MPEKEGGTLYIGGPWDGARAFLSARNQTLKYIVTVHPIEYERLYAIYPNGMNVLALIEDDVDVFIYQRFGDRLYYQRTCKNRDVADILGCQESILGGDT